MRAAVFVAATELSNGGHVLPVGTTAIYEPELSFSSGHGRHRGGETVDLAIPYLETIYMNPLSEPPTELSDPDIYVRDLVVDGVHPGIQ